MTLKTPTLALCVIVKPTDEEAKLLDELLYRVSRAFDEIYITITGENKECERIALKHKAEVSRFEWINDFAAARNFNFSQAKTDYIMWLDADDDLQVMSAKDDIQGELQAVEGLKKLMTTIGKGGSVIDAVVMEYLYDFDEYGICVVKHLKTRIVKNDGCLGWAGSLHEDFKKNREVLTEKWEEVKVVHRPKIANSPERIKERFARNTQIAKESLKKSPGDPRSYWLVGNALLSEGKDDEALENFYIFIERSTSDEEIFLSWHKIALIFLAKGDTERAFMSAAQAFRLRPYYPDPYYDYGKIFYMQGKLREAKEVVLEGLKKAVPENEMIVWNPRDYDINPMNLLARIYFEMNKPVEARMVLEKILKIYPYRKEIKQTIDMIVGEEKRLKEVDKVVQKVLKSKNKDEIKKVLDSIPEDLRSHPGVCHLRNTHFVKETSSGKDLVFFCGPTDDVWTPETAITKGIGGSEEAVINLSKELVKRGWNVEVYNSCGQRELNFDGVKYRPYWMWNSKDKQDITVIWRMPKMLDYEINSTKLMLDLHDAIPAEEFTSLRINKVSKIFVKSKAQRDLFPTIPDEKFAIIPNGVDVSLFDKSVERDPYVLLNTSSPDRSLEILLELYEEVLKRLPGEIRKKVRLKWFYGWNVFDGSYSKDREAQEFKARVMTHFNKLKEQNLTEGGTRIGHGAIAEEYLKAGALVYPTEFYEIDFIGGSKAQIAGAVPITTDFASLNEKIQFGVKIHSDRTKNDWTKGRKWNWGLNSENKREQFIRAVVDYLNDPHKWDDERVKMSKWAREQFNWGRVSGLWEKELTQ